MHVHEKNMHFQFFNDFTKGSSSRGTFLTKRHLFVLRAFRQGGFVHLKQCGTCYQSWGTRGAWILKYFNIFENIEIYGLIQYYWNTLKSWNISIFLIKYWIYWNIEIFQYFFNIISIFWKYWNIELIQYFTKILKYWNILNYFNIISIFWNSQLFQYFFEYWNIEILIQ